MGNILQFDRNKKSPTKKISGVESIDDMLDMHIMDILNSINAVNELHELEREIEQTGIKIETTDRLRLFLLALKGDISKDAQVSGIKTANMLSFKEAKDIIENSNEAQWKSKPGYFSALLQKVDGI